MVDAVAVAQGSKSAGGWIAGPDAFRRVALRISDSPSATDPAPWLAHKSAAYWSPLTPQQIADQKLFISVVASIQGALLDGALVASVSDGRKTRRLPPAAFEGEATVRNVFRTGNLEIDPLWPDDWQEWNGQSCWFPEAEFEAWLASPAAMRAEEPPPYPSAVTGDAIQPLTARPLSNRSRVALSESVTWLAFGLALDADRTERAVRWGRLCGGDFAAAVSQMEAAANFLLDAGTDGKIAFFGRHEKRLGTSAACTQKIDPLQLGDYGQAMILTHDHLYFGRGLAMMYGENNKIIGLNGGREDLFTHVTVSRDDVLNHCMLQQRRLNAPISTGAAETECSAWLENEFASDPNGNRARASFQSAALAHFEGRLSKRGFDRVWSKVAAAAGRSGAGRKSPRRIDSPV